jgi:hypothetical protein
MAPPPATANGDAFIRTGIDRRQARLAAPWPLPAPIREDQLDQIDDAVVVSGLREWFHQPHRDATGEPSDRSSFASTATSLSRSSITAKGSRRDEVAAD